MCRYREASASVLQTPGEFDFTVSRKTRFRGAERGVERGRGWWSFMQVLSGRAEGEKVFLRILYAALRGPMKKRSTRITSALSKRLLSKESERTRGIGS